jgi:ribosomal protein S6E (S10)
MRKEIEGVGRKRGYFSGGVGVKIKRNGMKKRKTICCNTITKDIVQINLKVTKAGSKTLEEIFAKPKAEAEPKAE